MGYATLDAQDNVTSWSRYLPADNDGTPLPGWVELADDDPRVVAYLHPEQTLEGQKAAKIAELSAACKAAIEAGFESGALGSAHHYDGDMEAQLNLVGAAQLGASVDYTCTEVASGDKAPRTHTSAQMKQVMKDGAGVKMTLLAQFRDRKAQVDAATTEAEVDAVSW